MYKVTDTDIGSADVPANDERTSDWYYRQSHLLKGQDVVTYTLMGSLKRRLEQMQDTMVLAESVFNASVSSERKRRLICRINTEEEKKLVEEYGLPPCSCNDERM